MNFSNDHYQGDKYRLMKTLVQNRNKVSLFKLCLATFFLIFLVDTAQVFAQAEMIEVGANIPVSSRSSPPITEPQLVANPKNPKHLLAGAIVVTSTENGTNDTDCAAFTSFDGGQSWSQHNFELEYCYDPWVILRADGIALFTILSAQNRILIYRSSDGGRTWGSKPVPHLSKGNQDHQTLALDTTTAQTKGNFYLLSVGYSNSIVLATSADGGKTFSKPLVSAPINLHRNTLTATVLSDGTLVLSYFDFARRVDETRRQQMLSVPSISVMRSTDGGKTLSTPLFVTEQCALQVGFPSIISDQSDGVFRDRIYLVCVSREKGITVHRSTSRGEFWSNPVRVDKKSGEVEFRRTPSIAVNKDGVVGVTWYERRKIKGGDCRQKVYFAASFDGGKTFKPEVQVSTDESCPNTEKNGRAGTRWAAGGDYSGLTATSDGRFHVLWADSRNGIYQLYTAAIKINSKAEDKTR